MAIAMACDGDLLIICDEGCPAQLEDIKLWPDCTKALPQEAQKEGNRIMDDFGSKTFDAEEDGRGATMLDGYSGDRPDKSLHDYATRVQEVVAGKNDQKKARISRKALC